MPINTRNDELEVELFGESDSDAVATRAPEVSNIARYAQLAAFVSVACLMTALAAYFITRKYYEPSSSFPLCENNNNGTLGLYIGNSTSYPSKNIWIDPALVTIMKLTCSDWGCKAAAAKLFINHMQSFFTQYCQNAPLIEGEEVNVANCIEFKKILGIGIVENACANNDGSQNNLLIDQSFFLNVTDPSVTQEVIFTKQMLVNMTRP